MKFLFCALTIFCTNMALSQNIAVEYSVSSSDKISKCELFVTDSISNFKILSDIGENEKSDIFFIKKKYENTVFFSEKLFSVQFFVKDSLHCMVWKLAKDTATILGHKCLSAITNFRGRSYVAYYSPEYGISDGPGKFGGLPGLILSVKANDNFVEWKATRIIENPSKKIEIISINKYKFLDWDEYVKKYILTIEKYVNRIKSNGTLGNGNRVDLKIEAVEIFYPELQTGNGITIE